MLDKIWFIAILFIIYLSILLNNKIGFKTFNLKKLFNKVKINNLFLSLGTKIGVGNLIGITMSIYIGGNGSIFWIYFFGFITSSIVYCECKLANKYKSNGTTSSNLIIKNGLHFNSLSILTSVIFVFTYCILFLMIQSNTLGSIIKINKTLVIIPLLFTIIICNRIDNLDNIIKYLLSIILLIIIILGLYVTINNITIIPIIYKKIIKNAFNKKSMIVGLIIGIKRAVFMSELLIGTNSVNSYSDTNDNESISNTIVLSSYFVNIIITFFISTIILMYNYYNSLSNQNYIDILFNSFMFNFNYLGKLLLELIIITLSFSTIVSGINISKKYIKNKIFKNIYCLLSTVFIIQGLFININVIWNCIDIFMLILIIINGITLYLLKDNIEEEEEL